MKSMKPGGGGRFEKLKAALERKGAKSPGGLAAHIGRSKHGKAKMSKWAARGRGKMNPIQRAIEEVAD